MTAEAHGLGWATVLFYGNIDGTPHGDANNPEPAKKLGSWIGLLPFGISSTTHNVGGKFEDSFNRNPKTYKWDASGSIKLVPVYWKWRLSLPFPGGTWEEASSIHHSTKTASTGGSWTVARNWTTLNRASPGNRSGSGGSSSSGCANNETYNYCDDQGSCSVGSGSGVPGPVCGHNYCCCTPGSNTGSTPPTGSTPSPPSMLACGVHSSGTSGDHSLQASCSSSNSNGTCTVSNFYACQSHTHSYPSPPAPTPTPPPNTVTCGAGHTYSADHPNRSYLDNLHRTRTCRFSGCSNEWQACSIEGWSPLCNNPYRNQNGWNCGAQ